jgi:hypothetical protein
MTVSLLLQVILLKYVTVFQKYLHEVKFCTDVYSLSILTSSSEKVSVFSYVFFRNSRLKPFQHYFYTVYSVQRIILTNNYLHKLLYVQVIDF